VEGLEDLIYKIYTATLNPLNKFESG